MSGCPTKACDGYLYPINVEYECLGEWRTENDDVVSG